MIPAPIWRGAHMAGNTVPTDIAGIVASLAMEPHPIAGWYAPHYSDSEIWGRPKLSSIYLLLAGGQPMPPHKADATEIWHFYSGAPAQFRVSTASGSDMTSILGNDLAGGQRPQLAVPAYLWQECASLGDWTLLGCTASPGFSPRGVRMIDTA
jgi:predicted cupin superfamily sugar epimerase